MPIQQPSPHLPATDAAPLTPLHLHPGQSHAVAVSAGSELFCTTGHVLLHSGPQGLIDGLASMQWQLSTGQRWRAPCALWLQLSALDGPARLQYTLAPAPSTAAGISHPGTLGQWPRGLIGSRGWRGWRGWRGAAGGSDPAGQLPM